MSEMSKYVQITASKVMGPTNRFRIKAPKHLSGFQALRVDPWQAFVEGVKSRGTLQQAYTDHITGYTEWRDVEIVSHDTPDEE